MDTTDGFMQASNVILEKMINIKFLDCRYVCALAFVDVTKNIEKVFVSLLNGLINSERQSNYGFGYDAIFYLPEYKKTLGKITAQEKNQISHRTIAIQKMVNWISKEDNKIMNTKINIVLYEPEMLVILVLLLCKLVLILMLNCI